MLRKRRRAVRTIVVIAIGSIAAVILLHVVAGIMFERQGVSPRRTLAAKHSLFGAAGVTCAKWSQGSNDMLGVGSTAWGTCTLGSGDAFRITAFREDSNKDQRTAPCPRVDGPRFWIDTSGLRDRTIGQRLAAVLGGTLVAVCQTPTS